MTGKNNNILNISLSILFFILAIVIYIIRITMPASNSNQLTDTLFSGFEIIFSVGIGIFLQRYESNRQYLDNLKKYALRAYRRISDIQKSVSRMATVIEQDRPVVDKETSLKLDTLQAINEGLNDTVQSSSADWVDILYPELEKKQRLDKLEEKRNEIETLSSSDKTTDRIYEQLTEEIRTLKSELPYLLRLDTKEELPRGGRYSDIVYKNLSVK